MARVRASRDNDLRFSPFVLIINDCGYEEIVKYVRLGLDDVIRLPEKAHILRRRLEAKLNVEQTYVETPLLFETIVEDPKAEDTSAIAFGATQSVV